MDTRLMRGRDLTALTAAGLAVVMAGVYVWLMNAQGDAARPWFAGVLVAGALLCAYGSRSDLSYRRPVLLVAAAGLSGVGVLALPSIG